MTTLDPLLYETEEQQHEQTERWRLAQALQSAPELLTHVRSIALSRPEAGETLPECNAPMRITAEDDASDVYARLGEWVECFAEAFNVAPPVPVIAAQRIRRGDMQGFRAHVTPEGAGALTRLLAVWLAIHADQIATHDAYTVYREDVTKLLWDLRKRYPLDKGRERPALPRKCTACGQQAVAADWWSENRGDVTVQCGVCGHTIDPKEYRRILEVILP